MEIIESTHAVATLWKISGFGDNLNNRFANHSHYNKRLTKFCQSEMIKLTKLVLSLLRNSFKTNQKGIYK